MARPNKIGLDYFPLDVDFFNDEKIGAIAGEFGIKGELASIKLLCAIYRQGYFIQWTEMLQMKLIKGLPGVSADLLNAIVSRLVRWGFFDKDLFDKGGIITSKGIQRRYFEATKRRVINSEDFPYLLVSANSNVVNVCNNPLSSGVNVNINSQSKVKEIKVKKSIKKNIQKKEFDFGKTLVDFYGCDPQNVLDWLAVRKLKKAANTETSLNALVNECKKHNFPISEAVKICAEKSWQGFKVEWVNNLKINNNGNKQPNTGIDGNFVRAIATGYARGKGINVSQ